MIIVLTVFILYALVGMLVHLYVSGKLGMSSKEKCQIDEFKELKKEKTFYSFVTRINILTAIVLRIIYLPVFIILKALKINSENFMFLEFEKILKEAIGEEENTNDIRHR